MDNKMQWESFLFDFLHLKVATYDFTNATWVESVAIENILTQKQLNKTTEKYLIAQ